MKRAKQLWLSQNSGKGLAILCLSLSILQGCSPKYPEGGDTYKNAKDGKPDAAATTTTTSAGSEKPADKTDAAKSATDKADADKSATGKPDSKAKEPGSTDQDLANQLPDIKAASLKVDLHNMPDTTVICLVKNQPITVGDYKEELKQREQRMQSMLSADPNLEQQLLKEANVRHVTLTADEKKKLIEQTKKASEASGKLIADFLKENNLTNKQYEDKILSMGLAAKTFAEMTRETLLNELVDKSLLVTAAKDKGYYQKAHNKYIELKVTPDFKTMLAETGMSAQQAQTKIIDQTLMSMYVDHLKEENSLVTDQEIQKIYDENREKLKHGERVRLSQIVIAAPQDSPDQPGIKEQLKQKFPTLSDKDLEAKANEYRTQQKRSAEDILAKIIKGAKFEDMANQYTDDPANKSMMNGGDIGWKEKSALEPDFVMKVSTLKVGQVYPHLLPTRFGYHIIKLADKQAPGTTPLADVREAIKQQLTAEKQKKAILDWATAQHKSGAVKLSPEFQKLIASSGSKTQ